MGMVFPYFQSRDREYLVRDARDSYGVLGIGFDTAL